jgi:hypothetical protein
MPLRRRPRAHLAPGRPCIRAGRTASPTAWPPCAAAARPPRAREVQRHSPGLPPAPPSPARLPTAADREERE